VILCVCAFCVEQLNSASSRSHCILTCYVESRSRVESADRVLSSKIHLVDLAGSERVTKTHSTGAILREAMYINKSLSFLEQCVNALSERGRDHVPFRQSRLTHFLRDSLGGNCKTVMIANIWGEAAQLDETISTLSFATRMMKVKSEVSVNVKVDAHLLVKKYEQEIKELKQELAMHDALSGRNRATYAPYTEEQRFELQQKIKEYCAGTVDSIEVVNLRHITELLQQFKIITNNALEDAKSGRAGGGGGGEDPPEAAGQDGEAANADGGVGELVGGGGGSIGRAPDGAKPLESVKAAEVSSPGADRGSIAGSPKKVVKKASTGVGVPDKNQAFEEFKETDGKELNKTLRENSASLKERRQKQKDLALVINTSKKQIDDLKKELEMRREQVQEGQTDEEEFAIVRSLKGAKAEYRQAFEDLKMIKSETEYLNKQVEMARSQLVLQFEAWYKASYEDDDGARVPTRPVCRACMPVSGLSSTPCALLLGSFRPHRRI
jgi:kinesin family protein 6/9